MNVSDLESGSGEEPHTSSLVSPGHLFLTSALLLAGVVSAHTRIPGLRNTLISLGSRKPSECAAAWSPG